MKTKEWHRRQNKDLYVKKALKEGFVSRSAYKLIEIENKYKILKSSNSILELGSSPGGWTQVIMKIKEKDDYKLISIDKLDLNISLTNRIIFIKGDFVDENIHKKIQNNYINKFNLILSDMSPNTIGHSNTDHLRIIEMSYE